MSRWVVLHVAVAFWFVAGLIGRNLTLARARSTDQVGGRCAGRARRPLERLMVIPGSFAVLLVGPLTAWAQGRPLAGSGNGWLLVSLLLCMYPCSRWCRWCSCRGGAYSTGRLSTRDSAEPSLRHWPARSATRRSRPRAPWSSSS
jgi:hypothetical protein